MVAVILLCGITARAQTVLTNGWSNPGAISAAAETDTWTVNANSGDRITVQIAKVSGGAGFTPRIELLAPNGALLGARSGGTAARLDIQADATGTYTLTVSDAARTGTGSYAVNLVQIPGAFTVPAGDEGGALTNGAIHPGSIAIGDLDPWTVVAGPGDRLTFQVVKVAGGAAFTPMIEVFAPDGARLAGASGSTVARVDVQAFVNGTYTVLVSDRDQVGAGGYQLQLAQSPGSSVTPAGDEGGALADAVDTNGGIVAGDLDRWTFTGTPGERVTLQITELTGGANFTPLIELFTPTGDRKAAAQNASVATIDCALELAGTYSVLVSDGGQTGAGTYQLRLTRGSIGPAGANILTNGGTFLGSITAAGESNIWTFTASAGESIVVRAGETATTGLFPWLRLNGPNGVLLNSDFNAAAAEVTVRATNSGTFSVVFADGSAGRNQTGNYRISLAKTGVPLAISASDEGDALANGLTYLASIDTGDIDAWTFTANAGENILVRMGETVAASPLFPWLRIYGPDGVLLTADFNGAAAEVAVRATNSGTFLVVATDGNNGFVGTGNYRISLARTGSPLEISPGDEGSGLTNGLTYLAAIDTGDVDAWTFVANAGETIVARVGETTGGSSLFPWLRLYGPNGVLLSQDFNAVAAEATVRATNSGTFMLVMADGNTGIGGAGGYRLSLAKTGSPLLISPSDEGDALTNGLTYLATIDIGDIDAWTFTASAGENIVVRMGETTGGSGLFPWLRLYGPNGVLLSQDFNAAAAETTTRATNSGTFLVVAADGNNGIGASGNYRLSLAKTGGPLEISASDEGGALTNGLTHLAIIDTGDIDAWTFTASAGDSIVVRMGETTASSPLFPWLRLYGPNGLLLVQDFNAAAGEVAVRATNSGRFMVVAADGNNGLFGTGNYRLTLAKSGEPLVISAGDEGGQMNSSGVYDGSIETGDVDAWTFTACIGNLISIRVTESVLNSPLYPWLRLYGRDGVLLRNFSGPATAEFTNYVAPASGTYTVVVGDGNNGLGGAGTFRMTVNGLSDGLKLCPLTRVGTNMTLVGIGGLSGAPYTMLTSTNVAAPLGLWTPLNDNFDPFGVVTLTNVFNVAEPHRFFILRTP